MAGIYDEEILGAREQAETARKLRELGLNPPKGQMVSGWYVRPSITQYLAEGLKGYGNVQREKQATEKYEGLRKEKTGKIAELLKQFPMAKESYPNAQIGADGPTLEARGEPVVTQPDGQDYMKWAVDMSQYSPETATLGSKLAEYDMNRKDKKEMAQEREAERQAQRVWQSQQAQIAREQNFANQRSMAQLGASLRQPTQSPAWQTIKTDEGYVQVNPQTGETRPLGVAQMAPGGAPPAGSPAARSRDANDAMAILQQAAPLIKDSTNSGMGNVADISASFFGKSTQGADTAAKLKALGGALVSKMPKMTGPQSDKDVQLYKDMAGNIGDPTIPRSQKEAAMRTINELQAKYAGVQPTELDFSGVNPGKSYPMPSTPTLPPSGAVRRVR